MTVSVLDHLTLSMYKPEKADLLTVVMPSSNCKRAVEQPLKAHGPMYSIPAWMNKSQLRPQLAKARSPMR